LLFIQPTFLTLAACFSLSQVFIADDDEPTVTAVFLSMALSKHHRT